VVALSRGGGGVGSRRIRTPHLGSEQRSRASGGRDGHWAVLSLETLGAYREELLAEGIVATAREGFAGWVASRRGDSVAPDNVAPALFRRFGEARYEELLEDFLRCVPVRAFHAALFTKGHGRADASGRAHVDGRWDDLDAFLPVSKEGARAWSGAAGAQLPLVTIMAVGCLSSTDGSSGDEDGCGADASLQNQSVVPLLEILGGLHLAALDRRTNVLSDRREAEDERRRRRRAQTGDDDAGGRWSSDGDGSYSEVDDDKVDADVLDGGDGDGPSPEELRRREREMENLVLGAAQDEVLWLLAQFFLEKLIAVINNLQTCPPPSLRDDLVRFTSGPVPMRCISGAFEAAARDLERPRSAPLWRRRHPVLPSSYRSMFCLGRRFFRSLRAAVAGDVSAVGALASTYCGSLVDILGAERNLFPVLLRGELEPYTDAHSKARICKVHSDLVACVCVELATILAPPADDGPACHVSMPHSRLVRMTESLLWFHKLCRQQVSAFNSDIVPSTGHLHLAHRSAAKILALPVASVMVALCGVFGDPSNTASASEEKETCTPVGSDYIKTRRVISEIYSESFNFQDEQNHPSYDAILEVWHAVHCIDLLFGAFDDKKSSSFVAVADRFSDEKKRGPFLPLIVVRVLGKLADVLLLCHVSEGGPSAPAAKHVGKWAESYAKITETVGSRLDGLMCRAYRFLHGFYIISDPSTSTWVPDAVFIPENTAAAAHLYRCVRRKLSKKRSVQNAILTCIGAAIPPLRETEKSKCIRKYIFESGTIGEDVSRYENVDGYDISNQFPVWVLNEKDDTDFIHDGEDEGYIVARGLCKLWTKGMMPTLGTVTSEKAIGSYLPEEERSSENNSEERENIIQLHTTVSKKVRAIITDLCYSPKNYEGWFTAAQCFNELSAIICDRLDHFHDYFEDSKFSPSACDETDDGCVWPVEELQRRMKLEYENQYQTTVHALCSDLSVFLNFPWASFTSLKKMSLELKQDQAECVNGIVQGVSAYPTFEKIRSLYNSGELSSWQQAWGGQFVSAFRTMADRCLCMSHHLAREEGVDSDELCSIKEFIATHVYSKIQGGVKYGYPLASLPDEAKFRLAICSENLFQQCINLNDADDDPDNEECGLTGVPKWQLYFMLGKSQEKKSSAFRSEMTFVGKPSLYSIYIIQALESYDKSLLEAKRVDKISALDLKQGGSSNGIIEVIYRLHATRLKVLLRSMNFHADDRIAAEMEGLAVVENYWFDKSEVERTCPNYPKEEYKERLWFVLSDIVAAMAHCRQERPFFHRSVFRHAQALLWAPIFFDPDDDNNWRLMGCVPPTKSLMLRGMNSGGPSPNSSIAVMQLLFDKKRAQICSVWVTTPAIPSPFEMINDSTRKYTALRSKYTSAFIELNRLCNRTEPLKTLISWIKLIPRDLPSFYHITANNHGGNPKNPHSKDSLLIGVGYNWSSRRMANSSIADIILRQANYLDEESTNKQLQEYLRDTYDCFRRMNVSTDEIASLNYKMTVEIEALLRICLLLFKDLPPFNVGIKPMIEFAILKCRELFQAKEAKKRKSLTKVNFLL